jgi:ferrous iron transport protein B
MRIALAGNPNSGKTTLFNDLTGSRQRVGNYPGITVETRLGKLRFGTDRAEVIDLPGTYSLSAYSPEELAARNVLVRERPDVVVDVLDATNLERNLYLAVQFLELGLPLVLALNMMDEVGKRGVTLDTARLASLLNVPVVETVARSGQGRQELIAEASRRATEHGKAPWRPLHISYGSELDAVLERMQSDIERAGLLTDCYPARWVALKILEGDQEIMHMAREHGPVAQQLETEAERINQHLRDVHDTDAESVIVDHRYGFIASLLKQGVMQREPLSRRDLSVYLDRLLTNAFLGPAIMLGVLYGMFHLTFGVGDIPLGWVESFFGWLGSTVRAGMSEGLLRSLLVSGVIDGVGGVLSFVPLILIMFFCISILEDSGYMARMAYMLDRVFRTFGLHGSSIMPFVVSGGIPGGCAVPGVMATRGMRSPKEKLATLLTAPMLSCGAKVPVFLLLAGAFFPAHAAEALFTLTLLGWLMALFTAKMLRSTLIRGEPTPFVMELPPYRVPTLKGLLIHTWERGWQYIKKAGTIILGISILIWAAMTFPGLPEKEADQFQSRIRAVQSEMAAAPAAEKEELRAALTGIRQQRARAEVKHSLAGRIGVFLEPVSSWAGFDWRTNIALAGGFAAKEVIVSSLGTAFSLGSVDPGEARPLSQELKSDPGFTVVTAMSLMAFVLLYAPCFVTVVAIARESSWKWAGFSMVGNTLLAFAAAICIYQLGVLLV